MPSFIALLSSAKMAFVASLEPTEVVAWANELLDVSRVGRLGLLDLEGAPRVLPVTYAVAQGRIWSAIDSKPKRSEEPARLRFLRRDPRAALTVDRYSDEWEELAWVQVLGTVEVLDLEAGTAGLEALREKYRQYRADPPPGPLLALRPTRYLWWRAADRADRGGRSGGRGG
jgi:PPOX class probable F420-dependent enzyme